MCYNGKWRYWSNYFWGDCKPIKLTFSECTNGRYKTLVGVLIRQVSKVPKRWESRQGTWWNEGCIFIRLNGIVDL